MTKPCLVTKIDHLEVATSDVKTMQKLFENAGFLATQSLTDKTGTSVLMEEGHIQMLLTQGAPGTFAHEYAKQHGDGVCRLAYVVPSVEESYGEALKRGATSAETLSQKEGYSEASISSFGDVRATFMRRSDDKVFKPGFQAVQGADADKNPKDLGFKSVDHLTNNVEMGQLERWSKFYEDIFGFIETRYFDIRATKTGLNSKVMQTPNGSVRIPINTATEAKSQVQEFIDVHKGAGVQHIAFTTTDICKTVREMRQRGFKFLHVPDTYYEMVAERVPNVKENMTELKELNILVDGDETGYLLQIFSENQIGPLFFEIIQRKGHKGFGEGNFKALFEAMERDQERRGVL